MTQSIHLPQTVYDTIITHAREGKPEEICGVIRGRDSEAFEAIRGRNVAADKVNNYDVDPQTLLKQFEFEEAGEAMMGIYHSHPISVAYPSATDAWNAHYPDSYYLICSLEFDDAPVIRAFRLLPTFLDNLDPSTADALRRMVEPREVRPGSHIFAHYVDEKISLPTVVDVKPPFYLLVRLDEDEREVVEARVVEVREHGVAVG